MGFFSRLIKDLINLERDAQMIMDLKCPECGVEWEEDGYDGDYCYLCPECRRKKYGID